MEALLNEFREFSCVRSNAAGNNKTAAGKSYADAAAMFFEDLGQAADNAGKAVAQRFASVLKTVGVATLEIVDDIGEAARLTLETPKGATPAACRLATVSDTDLCSKDIARAFGIASIAVGTMSLGLPHDIGLFTTAAAWGTGNLLVLSSSPSDLGILNLEETTEENEDVDQETIEKFNSLQHFFGFVRVTLLGSAVAKISLLEACTFAVSLALGSSNFTPATSTLYYMGASWGPAIAAGQVWRLFMPILLHANLPHIVVNIVFQLGIGPSVEQHLRCQKSFLILYFGTGIFGNLISASYDPMKLAVGASTSGMGLLGATLVMMALNASRYSITERSIAYISTGIIGTCATMSATDAFGHAGGFLGGACMMLMISPHDNVDEETRTKRRAAGALIMLVVAMRCGLFVQEFPRESLLTFA